MAASCSMRRMPLVRCLPLLLAWIVLAHKHVAEGFYLPGVQLEVVSMRGVDLQEEVFNLREIHCSRGGSTRLSKGGGTDLGPTVRLETAALTHAACLLCRKTTLSSKSTRYIACTARVMGAAIEGLHAAHSRMLVHAAPLLHAAHQRHQPGEQARAF